MEFIRWTVLLCALTVVEISFLWDCLCESNTWISIDERLSSDEENCWNQCDIFHSTTPDIKGVRITRQKSEADSSSRWTSAGNEVRDHRYLKLWDRDQRIGTWNLRQQEISPGPSSSGVDDQSSPSLSEPRRLKDCVVADWHNICSFCWVCCLWAPCGCSLKLKESELNRK